MIVAQKQTVGLATGTRGQLAGKNPSGGARIVPPENNPFNGAATLAEAGNRARSEKQKGIPKCLRVGNVVRVHMEVPGGVFSGFTCPPFVNFFTNGGSLLQRGELPFPRLRLVVRQGFSGGLCTLPRKGHEKGALRDAGFLPDPEPGGGVDRGV